jgi:hypothetical protein
VTQSARLSGRIACAIAGSLLVAGCAVMEAQTTGSTSGPHNARVALKDAAWTAPAVKPAPPKVASNSPRPTEAPHSGADVGSCGNADQCALLLRQMIDDPTRSWIGKRPTVAVFANGTRLFAYRALRAKLSCSELTLALEETLATASSLNGGIAGLTLDQVAGVRTLNAEVEGELRAQRAERCKSDLVTPRERRPDIPGRG